MSQDIPSILYKYMPEQRKDFFDNLECEISLLGDLDILFDYAVGLSGLINPKIKISSVIDDHISTNSDYFRVPDDHEYGFLNRVRKIFCPIINVIISEQKKEKKIQNAIKETDEINENNLPMVIARLRKNFFHTRILSLIERNDSVAIWSNSAYRHANLPHSGFMIGFDTKHSFFNNESDVISALQKVIYSSAREKWYFTDSLMRNEGDEISEKPHALLYTKNDSFSYEKEWRMAVSASSDPLANSKVETIQCEMIKEVCLGARASADLEKAAFAFCSQNAIPLFRMVPTKAGTLEPELLVLS